jgi:hypothetical protein
MSKYNDCYYAYERSKNYKFEPSLTNTAVNFLNNYIYTIEKTLIDNLYINCNRGVHYYDHSIYNISRFTIHLAHSQNKIDTLNGLYKRKIDMNSFMDYPNAPKLIDYIYDKIKRIDYRFNIEEIKNEATVYTFRISL